MIDKSKIYKIHRTYFKHVDHPKYLFASMNEMEEIISRIEAKEAKREAVLTQN